MSLDLSDSVDRLYRAEKILAELNSEINIYRKSSPLKIYLVPFDAMIPTIDETGTLQLLPDPYAQSDKDNFLVLRACIEKEIPKNINLILGDALENIRICYEYLAREIGFSINLPDKQQNRLHYPSTKSESDLDGAIINYFSGYENLDIVKKIKLTKPFFNGGYNIKEVAELSNLNKHRKPISFVSFAGDFPVSLGNSLGIGSLTIGINPQIGYSDIIVIHKSMENQISYSQPTVDISIDFAKIGVQPVNIDISAPVFIKNCITNANEVLNLFK